MKKIAIATVLLLAVALGGAAFAHGSADEGFFHRGGGPAVFQLLRELNLRDEQIQHLENLHGIADEVRGRHAGSAGQHAAHVAEKLDSNAVFTGDEARLLVDTHLEQMRTTAYTATDEITALLNSLDADQRAVLSSHLNQVAELHAATDAEGAPGHGALARRMLRHLFGRGQF